MKYKLPSQKPIPVAVAEKIAKDYGYHQVIIVARRVGETDGGEHVTTYGIDRDNCIVAECIGNFLKYKVMKWYKEHPITRSKVS